jgi:hypothetical protein
MSEEPEQHSQQHADDPDAEASDRRSIQHSQAQVLNIPDLLAKTNLRQLAEQLSNNLAHYAPTLDNPAVVEEDSRTPYLYLYGAHTSSANVRVANNAHNTRSARANIPQKVVMTLTQYYRAQSPDGPYCFNLKHTGPVSSVFDPKVRPYQVYRIHKDYIDFANGTIDIENASPLDTKTMDSLGTKELLNHPLLRGKITLDNTKKLVYKVYDLRKERTTGKEVWKPNNKFLRISAMGNYIDISALARGDEVIGRLIMGPDGSPFVTCVAKATMLNPDNTVAGSNILLEPDKFKCRHTNLMIDSRASCKAVETPTILSTSVAEKLKQAHGDKNYLNFVPSAGTAASYGVDSLHTITAEDIEKALAEKNLETPLRWYQIGLDAIHELFLESKSPEEIKELTKTGHLDDQQCANWVIHFNHENTSLTAIQMVIRDYATPQTPEATDAKVKSTTIITKAKLPGRAGDIESMSHTHNVQTKYVNDHGYMVPVISRPYNSLIHNLVATKKNEFTYFKKEGDINMNFTFHKLTRDAHKSPTLLHRFGHNDTGQSGSCLVYSVLYPQDNAGLKKLFVQLSEQSKGSNCKHFGIRYVNGADSPYDVNIDKRQLTYGRFREILVELQPHTQHEIIGLLNSHGAFLGPQCQQFCNASNSFRIVSKHYIPFPKELEKLRTIFKSITILDRCKFQVELKSGQHINDVPSLLEFSQPSEHESVCLNTSDNSPWIQIDYKDKSILLNNSYIEQMPECHNTVYVRGFNSIYDSSYIVNFIAKYTECKILIEIADDTSQTDEKKVVARFLQDMNADKKSRDITYTLAITTNNSDLTTSLKQKLHSLPVKTNGKHALLRTGIQRLKLTTQVLSNSMAYQEYDLFKKNFAHLLTPPVVSENDADDDTDAKEGNGFTQVQRNGKRQRNNTPPSSSSSQQANKPNGPKVAKNKTANRSNKYGALVEGSNGGSVPEKKGRVAEEGDFEAAQDTLVKAWMEKNIVRNENISNDISKEDLRLLYERVVEHVTRSSPDYHSHPKLPSMFLQNGKLIGLGPNIVRYLAGADDKDQGKIKTLLRILLNRLAPSDAAQRVTELRSDIVNATQMLIKHKTAEKLKDAEQMANLTNTPAPKVTGTKRSTISPLKNQSETTAQPKTKVTKPPATKDLTAFFTSSNTANEQAATATTATTTTTTTTITTTTTTTTTTAVDVHMDIETEVKDDDATSGIGDGSGNQNSPMVT